MTEIRPLSAHTGVEITGVDITRLDEDGFRPIYAAWLDYGVAVVRDQTLEIEDFIAYSRRFGHVVPHPSRSTRHPDHPEVTVLGGRQVRRRRPAERGNLPARRGFLAH